MGLAGRASSPSISPGAPAAAGHFEGDRMQNAPQEESDDTAVDLVLALCHEIGNVVGAIRLHAHLLDPDMAARELARTTVDLDDLSARAGSLLAQIRPLLRADPPGAAECDGVALMAGLRELLLEQGGRGTVLRFEAVPALPTLAIDGPLLHALLCGFAFKAIEAADGRGHVRIRAERRHGAVAIEIEDDAASTEDLTGWRDAARRGRPLLCAVANHLLAQRGGSLEVDQHASGGQGGAVTCVALIVPVVAAAPVVTSD